MKSVKNHYSLLIFVIFGVLAVQQSVTAQNTLSPEDKKLVSEFERQAKEYSALRERVEAGLAKLPIEASAEQIETHKLEFQKAVIAARRDARQGYIFTPEASRMIRAIIKTEFSGKDGAELRKKVLEAETKGVPVGINLAYPDSKEQIEMPPTLLLALPQLPKQLRYRFVGTYLLLLDRENDLIIDYMPNALP